MNELFYKELYNIIGYIIYTLNEPNIAKKKYNQIMDKIYNLKYFSEGCPKVYYDISNIRKLIFDNYIIIYQIFEDQRYSSNFTYLSF